MESDYYLDSFVHPPLCHKLSLIWVERGVMWWPEPALYYCWLVIGRSIDMNEDWSRQKATVPSEISPDSDFVFTVLSMRVRYPLLRLCQLLWQLARTGHNDALHTHHTPQRALRATTPHTTHHTPHTTQGPWWRLRNLYVGFDAVQRCSVQLNFWVCCPAGGK